MKNSKRDDGCLFGGEADICKEFGCYSSSKEINLANQSEVDVSEIGTIRRADKKETSLCKEMTSIQTKTFVVSPEAYRTLLENLYITRLGYLRVRNIAMNQLDVYKEEAIEHMHEIKRIVREELEDPDVPARPIVEELVRVGTKVIRNQQALNRVEMEESLKNLDSILDTLSSDVKEVKSQAETEYEEEIEQRSCMELIFDNGHWCLFILYVFIILILGLSHYLPTFGGYF